MSQIHRVAMCELAVASSEWIDVSSWETEQPFWTPTAFVLQKYQEAIDTRCKEEFGRKLTKGEKGFLKPSDASCCSLFCI